MIIRNTARGVLVLLALLAPASAQEGAGLDAGSMNERGQMFINARTALELNYLCNAYKSVEHWAVGRVANEALGATGWYEAATNYDEYVAYVDEQRSVAKQRAADLGCSPSAEPIVFGFLEEAMGEIFGDLLLAFHFASLPTTDDDYLSLTQDQIAAAQQYDMYLQQRFGANFEAFAQHHRDRVGRALSEAMTVDDYYNPYDPYGIMGLYWYDDPLFPSWDLNWEVLALRSDARTAIDRVLLEVMIETDNLRMFDREHDGMPYADIVDAESGRVAMKVWAGPAAPYFNEGFEASYLLTVTEAGSIGFIVWSKDAADQLGDTPTIAIHANPNRVPKVLESEYEFYRTPEWVEASERFEARRLESCLGTLCYEFSAEDVARLIGMNATDTVEMIISPRADAGPAVPTESGFRSGSLSVALLRQLYTEWIQD